MDTASLLYYIYICLAVMSSLHDNLLAVDDVETLLGLLQLLATDSVDNLLSVLSCLDILDTCTLIDRIKLVALSNLWSTAVRHELSVNDNLIAYCELVLCCEFLTAKVVPTEYQHTVLCALGVSYSVSSIAILGADLGDICDEALDINLCSKTFASGNKFLGLCYCISCLWGICDINDDRIVSFLEILYLGNLDNTVCRC